MDFNAFLNQAWNDHAAKSAEVLGRLPSALALIRESAQIGPLAHLITHVSGEHLGAWDEGLRLLDALSRHEMVTPDAQSAIARSIAALRLARDPNVDPVGLAESDLARVFAVAAAALAGQGDVHTANRLLSRAVTVSAGLSAQDPAQRALAITGNNLAVGLEEKSARSHEENDMMVRAATLSLEKWSLSGGWSEISIANYRLAKSLSKAGRFQSAIPYARACLQMCLDNSAGGLDLFFAYEIMSLVQHGAGAPEDAKHYSGMAEKTFAELPEADRKWAAADFARLKALF